MAVGLKPSVAELQEQLAALTRELGEAREQQTATANILKVISHSTYQLQPVFDTIIQTARRLCDAEWAALHTLREGKYSLAAADNATEAMIKHASEHPIPPGRGSLIGRTAIRGDTVHIPDCLTDPEYTRLDYQTVGRYRSMLGVPLLHQCVVIGVIALVRNAIVPFTDRQIDLAKTFADQAVIAIENVRLFEAEQGRTRELTESLQQQTATADVLKVISRSAFDLQTVLDTLVESAAHLCAADRALIYRTEGEILNPAASFNVTSELREFLRHNPIRPGRDSCVARTALERHTTHIEDTLADPEYSWGAKDVEPIRTVLGVPLLRGGELLGVIVLYKHVVRPFTDKQIDLVTTFADQAVIAIENTRLLSELRESLQQQTATADVLKVISQSTFDLQAVLDTLVKSATRLCDADHTFFFQRDGEHFRWSASYGHETDVHAKLEDYFRTRSVPADRGSVTGRTALVAKVVHVTDVLADPEYTWSGAQEIGGWRAALGVPLLRKGDVVGVLFIAKTVPQPFTAKQIELAVTFADQAVIAIENTRLLKELRESLLQQTATAEVLKVISRSAFDLQAVLDTLVKSAVQLCEADQGVIARPNEAGFFQMQAHFGFSTELKDEVERIAFKPGRGGIIGRVLLERTTVQIVDAQTDPEYKLSKAQKLGSYHSMIGTPLLREGTPIGAFGLARKVVRPFTDKQMALLTTFADQAVIAIENNRLLNELRESLQQQTATADVLSCWKVGSFIFPTPKPTPTTLSQRGSD